MQILTFMNTNYKYFQTRTVYNELEVSTKYIFINTPNIGDHDSEY